MAVFEAWLNSVPAAVWWIQSDTMLKHDLVSASFSDRVLLSASVKCSDMSTNIYLNDADIKSTHGCDKKIEMTKHSIVYLTLLFPFTGNAVISITHLPRNRPLIWSLADQICSSQTLKIVRPYRCLLIGSERYDSWTSFTVASRDCGVLRCPCSMQENMQTLFKTWWMLCSGSLNCSSVLDLVALLWTSCH